MITSIQALYMTLIFFSVLYVLISLRITRREIRKGNKRENSFRPGVTILKPLKGVDDGLKENLQSFFKQSYSDFEIIFGVNDKSDPAIEVVNKLIHQYPHVKSRLVIDNRKSGLNPKINNLQNMYRFAQNPYILISDSNTRVNSSYLTDLIGYFSEKSVGLVVSALRGIGAQNSIAAMENMHLNTFVTPSVFSIPVIFNRYITIGKSMLFSKDTLEKIGGFSEFSGYLAEDHLIGLKIDELGLKTVTAPVYVNTINENWTLKQFLNRHTRWAKMRKSVSALDYLAETLANPLALGFVYMIVITNLLSVLLFISLWLFKSFVDIYIMSLMKSPLKWRYYLLSPIKDLIIGLIWYIPFFSRRITWRGNSFYIGRNTMLHKKVRFV